MTRQTNTFKMTVPPSTEPSSSTQRCVSIGPGDFIPRKLQAAQANKPRAGQFSVTSQGDKAWDQARIFLPTPSIPPLSHSFVQHRTGLRLQWDHQKVEPQG